MAKPEEKKLSPAAKAAADAADLKERTEGFNKELSAALGKFELGIGAQPIIMPDGRLAAQPVIVDARKKPEDKKPEEKKKLQEG